MRNTCLIAVALTLSAGVASATENSNEEYPIGVNTVLPGVEPPAGHTEYLNYSNFYDIGSDVGPTGNKAAPGFHTNVLANAFRVLHSWDLQYGNFWFTSGFVVPLVNLNIRVAGQHTSDTGFGDVDLQTLYLNWHNSSHTVFAFGGLDVYLPSGGYDPHQLANLGLNYTTFMPNGAVSWFVSKRLQLSLFSALQVPTENKTTHYKTGDSIDFDWGVDYAPIASMPRLFFGLQGYAFQQLQGDKVNDVPFQNGNEGRALAIGPQIRYDFHGGGIALKYQHEFAVENRTKGEKVWLQFALPIEF